MLEHALATAPAIRFRTLGAKTLARIPSILGLRLETHRVPAAVTEPAR
jgi:hypothetical protein